MSSKRTKSNRFRSVQNDILAVDRNIKPAYLWDVHKATAGEVQNYLNELHVAGSICHPLRVFQVSETLVVCLAVRLVSHLRSILRDDVCVYVDITTNVILKEPTSVDKIEEMIEGVLKQFEEISTCPDNSEVEIRCDSGWNLTCLFGILSGYPVVYWYDCDLERNEAAGGLFLSELRVYNVSAKVRGPKGKVITHRIYSFSVPDCLVSETRCYVSRWFDKLVTKTISVRTTFESLHLDSSVTELYSVAL